LIALKYRTRNATTRGSTGLDAAVGVTLMIVAGGGVAVGVAAVVGRPVPDTVDVGCVLGALLDGVVEGRTADEGAAVAGAVLGCAQLGGLAGTVGIWLAGLALGDLVVGSEEACAAGEAEAPDVTAGWLACWAVAIPECPVRALTAA
jgi:hypothetical protein